MGRMKGTCRVHEGGMRGVSSDFEFWAYFVGFIFYKYNVDRVLEKDGRVYNLKKLPFC